MLQPRARWQAGLLGRSLFEAWPQLYGARGYILGTTTVTKLQPGESGMVVPLFEPIPIEDPSRTSMR